MFGLEVSRDQSAREKEPFTTPDALQVHTDVKIILSSLLSFFQLAQDEGSPVRGFGVVEYESAEQAEAVLIEMDRTLVGGQEVRLSLCTPGTSGRSTLAALIAAQGMVSTMLWSHDTQAPTGTQSSRKCERAIVNLQECCSCGWRASESIVTAAAVAPACSSCSSGSAGSICAYFHTLHTFCWAIVMLAQLFQVPQHSLLVLLVWNSLLLLFSSWLLSSCQKLSEED